MSLPGRRPVFIVVVDSPCVPEEEEGEGVVG